MGYPTFFFTYYSTFLPFCIFLSEKHYKMDNHINNINSLTKFYDYCQNIVDENAFDDEDDLFDIWMLAINIDKPTIEQYIADVENTVNIYNKWLSEAVQNELFLMANIIKKALDIEEVFARQVLIKHFNAPHSSLINRILKESNQKYKLI